MEIIKHHNFSDIKNKWKKLYEDNQYLSAYQSDEYAKIAFSHYLPYAVILKKKPVFFEIIENGNTIMIIPLCKSILKNEYTLFGENAGCGYIDFIYGKDIKKDKIEECICHLSQKLEGSKLYLRRLREDSIVCQSLLQKYEAKSSQFCSHIDLLDSYDAYLATLKKDWRHHIRTAYNRLEADKRTISLKMIYNRPLSDKELSQVIDLYMLRRKFRYGHNEGMLYKLFLNKFDVGSIAMKKLDNYVHFILYIDDGAVAFFNGIISRDGTITVPRLAIDDEYAKYSPGIVLLNESIKKIFELGIGNKLDLIQGDYRYKHEMGAKPHYCYEFCTLYQELELVNPSIE